MSFVLLSLKFFASRANFPPRPVLVPDWAFFRLRGWWRGRFGCGSAALCPFRMV